MQINSRFLLKLRNICATGLIICALQNFAFAQSKALYVEISKVKIRSAMEHWAPSQKELAYGDSVNVIAEEGDWYKVEASGVSGYVPRTALTSKKILLKSGGENNNIRADDSDIVLAGKGFGEDLESQFRSANRDLNYNAVDQMLTFRTPDSDLQRFVSEGEIISRLAIIDRSRGESEKG